MFPSGRVVIRTMLCMGSAAIAAACSPTPGDGRAEPAAAGRVAARADAREEREREPRPSPSPTVQDSTEFRDRAAVEKAFGKSGEAKPGEGVYTTSFPRADLAMTVEGVAVPTALGFASWVAFKEGPQGSVAMSDLVLLPAEVDTVVSSLQASGIQVTALHRHFQGEQPQVMYLH
nr:DUF1259 domain-containing protein [Gemmatimonadota bacterium]